MPTSQPKDGPGPGLGRACEAVAPAVSLGGDHVGMALEHQLDTWLAELERRGWTDILLAAGSAARLRVDGRLEPLAGAPALTSDEIEAITTAATY